MKEMKTLTVGNETFEVVDEKVRKMMGGSADLFGDTTFANKDEVSNALKETAVGELIHIEDVSPIEHKMNVKVSGGANVRRCGKNLIPYPYPNFSYNADAGITATVLNDGGVLLNGTATGNVFVNLVRAIKYSNTDILPNSTSGLITNGDMNGVYCRYDVANTSTYVYIKNGTVCDNVVFYPQLEVGNVSTDYEQGVQHYVYAPDDNGNVKIPSLYPTTVLFTATDGAVIEAEYNKDLNTADFGGSIRESGNAKNALHQNFENNTEVAPSWSGSNAAMDEWASKKTSNGNDSNTITTDVNGKVVAGAYGANSVALNGKGQAQGGKSFAAGSKCVALGNNAFATGNGTFAGGQHTFTSGSGTSALGNSSFATGRNSIAREKNSFVFGDTTKANGVNSFSGGFFTEASGEYSFAIGDNSIAKSKMSVAEGYETESAGYASHSMGGRTKAKAAYTLSGGFETIASSDYQTVIGRANTEDTNCDYLFIVGNGKINDNYSVKERSNALTIDWDGNTEIAGNLTFTANGAKQTLASVLNRIANLEAKLISGDEESY